MASVVTERNVADAIVETLLSHGVDTVFALPGEENLHFVEALRKSPINVVLTRHEQHAAFMAATMGRLTGIPGVCLATLGPGATNLFTGLAHAKLGGYPMLAITGQKPSLDNREGSFQVLDIIAASRPVTKDALALVDPLNAVADVCGAIRTATAGRPGPVLIEIPEDVAAETTTARQSITPVTPIPAPSSEALAAATSLIERSARPLILVSEHANRTDIAAALTRCAEAVGIGVVSTQLGKGVIDEANPLALAPLGIHRPDYVHHAVFNADTIIAVGYDPVEHPPLSWNPNDLTNLIHVAPWPAAIERGYRPAVEVVGDMIKTLYHIADNVQPKDASTPHQLRHTIQNLLNSEPSGADDATPSPLDVVRILRHELDEDDIVALDNGAYKVWFARHYLTHRPQTLLLDNALATMGAGLAIGTTAALLRPDRRVVAVCGDGGFMMNLQDLETAKRLGVNLTVLVVRDDAYGFIGWHQDEENLQRFAVDVTNPDITQLANAFGATTATATTNKQLRQALVEARTKTGLHIIDCHLDYEINSLLDEDLFEQSRTHFEP